MKIVENGVERDLTPVEIADAGFEPLPEFSEPAKVIYPTDLWRRMTDAEVAAVEGVMGAQPSRIQRIFNAAIEYRSDDELWSLLAGIANSLFGSERAEEILAAS
jgi:hypothetical protein